MAYIGQPSGIGEIRKLDSLTGSFNNTAVSFSMTTTTGVQTTDFSPITPYNMMVVKNGQPLQPIVEFNVSGSTITFVVAPLTIDSMFIVSYGLPLIFGTPDDASVPGEAFAIGSIDYDNLAQSNKDTILALTINFGI